MKRTLLAAAMLLVPTLVFAAEVTRPYVVGTRHAVREAVPRILNDDLAPRAGRSVEPLDFINAFATQLTDDEVAALERSPNVAYVEPDIELHALDVPRTVASTQVRNTTGQTKPYGISLVHADSVWSVSSLRGAGINVAVLDTGIDLSHPDLQAAYAGGFNAYFGNAAYPSETANPGDDFGHGTHVAGTVAATDNNVGVIGVAPGVKLWAVRVLHNNGDGTASGPESIIVKGIQWVVNKKNAVGGNWIISMSLGSCHPGVAEQAAINTAMANGILIVVAAGNHDSSKPDDCSADNSYSVAYPAAFPGVVAVAAVDANMNVADFSNFGPQVAIAAPGVDVLSTVRVGTGSIAYVQPSVGPTLASTALTGSAFGTLTGSFVDCAYGATSADFPAAVNGKIALIKRGSADGSSVTFATKTKNAKNAGAAAVVIYNKDDSGLAFTLQGDPADANYPWPVTVAISLYDGQALLAKPNATITVANQKDDYGIDQGTSMATPHVSAVAALVWSLRPQATAEQVKQALIGSARDLGTAGVDNYYGYGLVDAWAAAIRLDPTEFPPASLTGRRFLSKGH
jgi:subtilisin family serine protease